MHTTSPFRSVPAPRWDNFETSPVASLPTARQTRSNPPREMRNVVLSALEAERKRIAADLHDEVGQLLTGLTCLGAALSKRLGSSEVAAASDANLITEVAKEALSKVRLLVQDLAPKPEKQTSLSRLLENLCARARRMHEVEILLDTPPNEVSLVPERSIHLLRIAQEAISNATRHGHATRIEISLTRTGDSSRFVIDDNGRGFVTTGPKLKPGCGLGNIKDRAAAIGAALEVLSAPDAGTRIAITFSNSEIRNHEDLP